jgi:hypothetical protein
MRSAGERDASHFGGFAIIRTIRSIDPIAQQPAGGQPDGMTIYSSRK